ncbi:alpha/beta hydrolase [Miniimonas arenae]|uniref:Alpha/beta hydrolase n=2 Tax=Miniimonas arenae TaxID=676201 RepID=A0A5C5BF63_9MICO|nr:alpha/beta hydrolase [Miniimonas arenae]
MTVTRGTVSAMTDLATLHHPGRLIGPLWAVATGTGTPLVVLHGNSETHHLFDRLVPLLAPHHTLVGLDSRAHGHSPHGDGLLRIASMADDVAEVLRRLGLHGVPVLGFSDGGNMALELALRHPGAVSSLVVVGANLFPAGLKPVSKASTDAAHAVSAFGARFLPALRPLAERLGLMVYDPDIDPLALHTVEVATLVVAGERDVIRPEHTALIGAALPHARVEIVPGVGHMVPRDAPEVLAVLVRQHLAGVAG